MEGFDSFDIGALIAVTVSIFIQPTWFTPIVWAVTFLILKNIVGMYKNKLKGEQ